MYHKRAYRRRVVGARVKDSEFQRVVTYSYRPCVSIAATASDTVSTVLCNEMQPQRDSHNMWAAGLSDVNVHQNEL